MMEKSSYKDTMMWTQIKLKALADVLLSKGIITEEELNEKYELAAKDFKEQLEELKENDYQERLAKALTEDE